MDDITGDGSDDAGYYEIQIRNRSNTDGKGRIRITRKFMVDPGDILSPFTVDMGNYSIDMIAGGCFNPDIVTLANLSSPLTSNFVPQNPGDDLFPEYNGDNLENLCNGGMTSLNPLYDALSQKTNGIGSWTTVETTFDDAFDVKPGQNQTFEILLATSGSSDSLGAKVTVTVDGKDSESTDLPTLPLNDGTIVTTQSCIMGPTTIPANTPAPDDNSVTNALDGINCPYVDITEGTLLPFISFTPNTSNGTTTAALDMEKSLTLWGLLTSGLVPGSAVQIELWQDNPMDQNPPLDADTTQGLTLTSLKIENK